MDYILTNLVAIAVATGGGLLLGLVYARAIGSRGGVTIGLALLAIVAEFWLACILAGALILAPSGAAGPGATGAWIMALASAVVIWIGFVLPTLLVTTRFEGVPVGRAVGAAGHWLVVMVAQAALLQLVGLIRPA